MIYVYLLILVLVQVSDGDRDRDVQYWFQRFQKGTTIFKEEKFEKGLTLMNNSMSNLVEMVSAEHTAEMRKLFRSALDHYLNQGPEETKEQRIRLALDFDGTHQLARTYLGFGLLSENRIVACEIFERVVNETETEIPAEMKQFLCMLVGRNHQENDDIKASNFFYSKAVEINKANDCANMQHALSSVSPYPVNKKEANRMIKNWYRRVDALLKMTHEFKLTESGGDPLEFCVGSVFVFSFHYNHNPRITLSKFNKLLLKAFPAKPFPLQQPPKRNVLRLGIVASLFQDHHSVFDDFSGVWKLLPFDVHYIYIPHAKTELTKERWVLDRMKTIQNIEQARMFIPEMQFDILFYPDLTMQLFIREIASSQLAPVQATSHGHPMTSGFSSSVVNYYVSWAAAETDGAQDYYSEKLILLPKEHVHQFYTPRSLPDGTSKHTKMKFTTITRKDFGDIPEDGTWYVNMHQPWKRQPEYDLMIKRILDRDPNAHIIMQRQRVQPKNQEILEKRLQSYGADVSRVHYLDFLLHHKLLALYRLGDVVLDSYPASGCTTSREAFEQGAVIVTRPAKYLGSRWTFAYYSVMGVFDAVANSRKQYIDIAVELGTNETKRAEVKQKIKDNLPKLYEDHRAVEAWTKIFRDMAYESETKSEL